MSTARGDTASEKSTYRSGRVAKIEDVDVAAVLDSDTPLEPEVAAKLRSVLTILMNLNISWTAKCRRKIDFYLMPLMCRES